MVTPAGLRCENEVVVKVGSGDYRFETLWTASKI
jgi:hypothetical protein